MEYDKKIYEHMGKLKKQIAIMKRKKFAEKGMLHTGEFDLMKQVARYTKEHNSSPTLVILSKNLAITQATVTPLVDRLVVKGYLIKESSNTDKRAKVVSLTKEGVEILLKNRDEERKRIHAVLEHLGQEDTETLIRILEKIAEYV